jgi:uncharacterized membrane protein
VWGLRFRAREWLARSWLVIPSAYVVAALALGRLIPEIDDTDGDLLGVELSDAAAQDILAAIAAGMIAFTGIVVAVAVVVVQFGASQYTPRLVLRFRRDPVVKHVLGVFIAPALYALVSLRDIGREEFAPNLTVAVGVLLVLVAVIGFFGLTATLLDLLRPRLLFAQLVDAGERAIAEVYPREVDGAPNAPEPMPPVSTVIPHHGPTGLISALDRARLAEAAATAGAVVEVVRPIGGFVHPGVPMFRVRGEGPPIAPRDERTITQDPAFAIRTIVDIALRALSPAVNDPTTAVQALDALEELLHLLARRDLEGGRIHSADGALRVVYPVAGWEELLGLALTEVRRYGASAPQVARRMRALLDDLVDLTPAARHGALERHLALLDAAIERAYDDPAERAVAATPDRLGLGGSAPPATT